MTTERKEVTLEVAIANDRGIKAVSTGAWHNYSKWATVLPEELPRTGEQVAVVFDSKGFIRECRVLSNGHTPTPSVSVTSTGDANTPDTQPEPAGSAPDRQVVITRLAVLNTAVSILASGGLPIVDPAEVITLAGQLEAWATRPA